MAIYGYTKNYKLIKPQFDTDTWHDYVYDNLDTIDAVMSAIYASGNWQGFWKKNTHYEVGDVVIDRDTDTMYKVLVDHTTTENTFALEQAAHPTYYEKWSPNELAESWATKMDGTVNYTDYSAKAYAVSSGLINAGSAKEWAVKTGGTIGSTGEYSAKKYAADASSSADYADASATSASASAMLSYQWAISPTMVVDTDYSAKSWATGSLDAGSAKDWAIKEGGQVGTTGKYSAKVYSLAAENHYEKARDWASKTNGQVESTDYSAKAYAISEGLISAGSAKEWATSTSVVADGKYGARYYSLQAYNANISAQGSKVLSQEWATKTTSEVDFTDYSSKAYAQSEGLISTGSSKEWATKTSGKVDGVDYSAKYYAQLVLPMATDIGTVVGISSAISAVAAIDDETVAVASNATNINTVAGVSSNVTTVATNISDVNTAATNIAAIQAAPTAASNAAASATLAQDWAVKMDSQVASTDYSSKYYAGQSSTSASNSHIWAEGTDAQVQALGGTHSAKEWANVTSGANKDLSNLTSAGEAHFANPALTNTGYTTNRILEIPQDIKLELNSGTLTLKAGSKVYIPNGFESNGTTPKFDVVTIANDIVVSITSAASGIGVVTVLSSGTAAASWDSNICSTGTTDAGNNTLRYRSDTNLVVRTDNSGGKARHSFPIAILNQTGTTINSIDQVFNGFGYIGSTVFVLPGVKTVVARGRKADGTCWNYSPSSYSTVKTHTISSSTYTGSPWYICANYAGTAINIHSDFVQSDTKPAATGKQFLWYDTINNVIHYIMADGSIHPTIDPYPEIPIIKIVAHTTAPYKITSFEPYTVDSVVNSNEFYQLKDNAVTLTDDQTISGQKTFTSDIRQIQNGSDTEIVLYDTGLASASVQSTSSRFRAFRVRASNGDLLGDVRFASSTGRVAALLARKVIGTTTHSPSISVTCDYLGNEYASCPTSPWPSDDSTRIATTAWVNTANKTGYGIGAPNYSAAVDITINSSTPYTATENGWVQVSLPDNYGYVYIDGIVFALSITALGYYSTYQAGIAPIAKGSSVTTSNAANLSIKFIPCK